MIFKNANIITDECKGIFDIKIVNGIIVEIGKSLIGESIDLEGKILTNGFVDMHCHLREPGFEYKETIKTGIKSAINGGYCAICPMANTNPVNDNVDTLKYISSKSGMYNLFPICAVTKKLTSDELVDFKMLKANGAIAFSNDGKPYENHNVLKQAILSDELIISHAEILELNGSKESEYNAIEQELSILRQIGKGKYHFAHISTRESVDLIRKAKQEGLNVTCETAPHYFSLYQTEESLINPIFKVNPPLRTQDDIKAIIEGLKDGTIDVIATDHAPHSPNEKNKSYIDAPMGIVGFETAIGLALTFLKQYMNLDEIFAKFSTNPAKILGLNDFGKLKIGNKANLTIIDENCKWTVSGNEFKSKCKFTPFKKMNLTGKSCGVIVNGEYYGN